MKALILALTAVCIFSGCARLLPGDSRSMSQKYDHCTFYIAGTPEAGDIFAQAQMIEHSGGDETDTASQTQEVETPVNVSVPTGTDAITALVGAGAKGITAGLVEGQNEEDSAKAVDPDCPDGNCSDAE
jgi:hypothetical protein